MEITNKIY